MTTITLEDGRTFPQYQGEALAWSPSLYMTHSESLLGYPRLHAVIDAMVGKYTPRLYREYLEYQRDCFGGNIFAGNARRYFNELVSGMLRNGITRVPSLFGSIEVKPWIGTVLPPRGK